MRSRFIELLLEEKDMGRTIFLSSHIFEEMEKTCDRVGMLVVAIWQLWKRCRTEKNSGWRIFSCTITEGEEHA